MHARGSPVRNSTIGLLFLQVALLVLAHPSLAKGPSAAAVAIPSAVLRVEVSRAHREWAAPWKLLAPEDVSGTAFVIAPGDRMLTNAHVVRDAQQITVKKNDGSAPAIATVDAVDDSCDLAVLRVADKTFLKGTPALELGDLPAVGSSVTMYGYPLGGQELSTTSGVVSRIETQLYEEGSTGHLAGQTDAAMNPGNSGGPVVQGQLVVGVSFEMLHGGQNIGFFIPTPIIHHFLDDLADGHYQGFPDAPLEILRMESPALRRERGLPADRSGVVIESIPNGSNFTGVVQPGDVLLSVDGARISDDGTYASGATRLPLGHLFDMKAIGQTVRLELWRAGTVVSATWKASQYGPWDRLHRPAKPRYLVYGGLLFVPLTSETFLAGNPRNERRAALLKAISDQVWAPGEDPTRELIVIAKVYRDPVNEGMNVGTPSLVLKVDGQPVHDLADLARILDTSQQARDVFEMVGATFSDLEAIDRKKALAARAGFLSAHGMTSDRSL